MRLAECDLSELEIVQLFKRMVPGHQAEMLCITLLCVPDVILTDISREAANRADDILKLILDFRRNNLQLTDVLAKEIQILSKTFNEGK